MQNNIKNKISGCDNCCDVGNRMALLLKTPIAHRGFHDKDCPENSMGAFKKAIENNFVIELDLRILKDGKVVVFHDAGLMRMCGVRKYVKRCRYNELKDLRLNKTSYSIPTFAEVLNFVNGKVPLLIELKTSFFGRKLEKEVLRLLKGYKGEYAIQSFNPLSLKWLKKHAIDIPRGYLSSFFDGSLSFAKKMVKRLCFARSCTINFISYDMKNLPNKYVEKYKNLPLIAYTVSSKKEWQQVKPYVDNIIFENFNPKK